MRRSTIALVALVTVMIGTLAALATLQYRWLGALSDAEGQSMRGAMEQALIACGMTTAYAPIVTTHGEVLHATSSLHEIADGDLLLADVGAERVLFHAV